MKTYVDFFGKIWHPIKKNDIDAWKLIGDFRHVTYKYEVYTTFGKYILVDVKSNSYTEIPQVYFPHDAIVKSAIRIIEKWIDEQKADK